MNLAGCASPNSTGSTDTSFFSLAGLSEAIMSGGHYAVSAITGDECNMLASVLRNGRSFCDSNTADANTSPEVKRGKNGSVILTLKAPEASNDQQTAAALDPFVLGFAPVNRRLAADFSLEIARNQTKTVDAPMLSFGMLSANYSPSFAYEIKLRDSLADGRVAMVDTPASAKR
jgi:hypothetical protein